MCKRFVAPTQRFASDKQLNAWLAARVRHTGGPR